MLHCTYRLTALQRSMALSSVGYLMIGCTIEGEGQCTESTLKIECDDRYHICDDR